MRRDLLTHAVRSRLKRLPAPHDSHYGVVPLPPPEEGVSLVGIAKRQTAAITAMARIDTLAEVASLYVLARILVRQEAVSSSAIEGTNSTLDELLSLEETSGETSGDVDVRQVRDYALVLGRFLESARGQGSAIFTLDLVKRIHAEIMKEDPDYADEPGALRTSVVWIGSGHIANSSWNAPPPGDVEACLEQTLDYMRNDGMQQMTQNVITRMAIAHAHFEAVHPFRDGNGRVGRILLALAMAAEGHVPLYMSPYIETHRQAYYEALKAAQQRLDWPAIVGFMCDAIVATVAHLEATFGELKALRGVWLGRRRFRGNSAALRALDVLTSYPVISSRRLAEQLGVGAPRAAEAVRQLCAAGILIERTGYRRNRLFCAPEVLAIIDRPFGERDS